MTTARITKRAVDALEPSERTSFLWDDELRGFGVRLTANGAKAYVFQYRLGGREAAKKRATIGRHGSPWTPDTARTEAKRLALLVGQGIDPVEADKDRRRRTVELAFGPYAQRFTDEYLKENWPGAWRIADGILRREALPAFSGLALSQITRVHVSMVLDRLSDRPATRRNAFAVLRRLFRWAVNRGDIPSSPITDMEAPPAPAARDRVLADRELKLVWEASNALGYPFGPFIRLLIITGQRREEIAGLNWAELDRPAALWTLPADRAKNGQVHLVPLSTWAISILDHLAYPEGSPDDEAIVWPGRGAVFSTKPETTVAGFSWAKRRVDAEIDKLLKKVGGEPLTPWRLHDLRRTMATGLQRLGIRFEVTEAVLNHVSGARGGVAGVYQRHDWAAEKREALERWGAWLATLTAGR